MKPVNKSVLQLHDSGLYQGGISYGNYNRISNTGFCDRTGHSKYDQR